MALLILDGAGPGVRASVPGVGERIALRAGSLAAATESLLAEAGLAAGGLDAIVGLVGPGSFTGLRAALALAHGIAAGAGVKLVAVGAAEAFAIAIPGRPLLAAFAGGRAGRFVLQEIAADGTIGVPFACDGATLSARPRAIDAAIVGPVADQVALLLGVDRLAAGRLPLANPPDSAIEGAARARLAGLLPPRAPVPIYADDLFDRAF